MMARHAKLITVLVFAVMLLILGLLVASVTSCSPLPTATVHTVPTTIPPDGTIYHPYWIDATPYGNDDTWDVLTVNGHEKWHESRPLFVLRANDYIMYHGQEYQISGINYQTLTMGAVILGN